MYPESVHAAETVFTDDGLYEDCIFSRDEP